MQQVPLCVGDVFIKGNNRTKKEIFDHHLQKAYEAQNLEQFNNGIVSAKNELLQLGIFDQVTVEVNEAKSGQDMVNLTIRVKEKNWWKVNVGATTDGTEGTAETTCTLVNPLGNGDVLHAKMTKGHVGSETKNVRYEKPFLFNLPLIFNMSASNDTVSNETHSSFCESYQGGSIALSTLGGFHELAFLGGLRDILPRRNPRVPTAFAASRSIIAEASPSVKTSVRYTYASDTRDSPIVPTVGKFFQCKSEIAGLFGDVQFGKVEGAFQYHIPFGPYSYGSKLFSLGFCSRIGGIMNYGNDSDRKPRISDRLYLGGSTSLRGFEHKGVGPRAVPEEGGNLSGDSLGGEFMYNCACVLGFPFPVQLLAAYGCRGQFFFNAGNLLGGRDCNTILSMRNAAANKTRVAVGFGMVWGTAVGRIEANYSWILRKRAQDRIQNAQLGISMSFS